MACSVSCTVHEDKVINRPFLASFQQFIRLDCNRVSLVSEETALSTEPQQQIQGFFLKFNTVSYSSKVDKR